MKFELLKIFNGKYLLHRKKCLGKLQIKLISNCFVFCRSINIGSKSY